MVQLLLRLEPYAANLAAYRDNSTDFKVPLMLISRDELTELLLTSTPLSHAVLKLRHGAALTSILHPAWAVFNVMPVCRKSGLLLRILQ